MDKGRMMDNAQNVNARYIDQYGATNKTSVRTSNPPGGKSSFSFGWEEPEQTKKVVQQSKNTDSYDFHDNFSSQQNTKKQGKAAYTQNYNYDQSNDPSNKNPQKTSVKVNHAPGGKSQICFGNDSSNYDDYKKN